MYPLLAADLVAAAHRNDLLRAAEGERRSRPPRAARRGAAAQGRLAALATVTAQQLRIRAGLVVGQRAAHQSPARACCA